LPPGAPVGFPAYPKGISPTAGALFIDFIGFFAVLGRKALESGLKARARILHFLAIFQHFPWVLASNVYLQARFVGL
jgi:hypothetical protein